MAVEPLGGRGGTLAVRVRGAASYVVKAGAAEARRHEAAQYRRLAERPALRALVVPLIAFDDVRGVLVLRYLRSRARGLYDPGAAAATGDALARLHGAMPVGARGARRPYALSLHRPAVDELPHLSEATLECLRLVQRSAAAGALDTVAASWRVDAYVHNDMRFANVLAAPRRRPKLVDWELAGPGDSAWDVGALLGDYVVRWIGSLPPAPGTGALLDVGRAAEPLERARPAIAALWRAYCERRGVAPGDRDWRERVMRMLGARLVMAAVERAQTAPALGIGSVGLLQVADNLLRDPAAFAGAALRLR